MQRKPEDPNHGRTYAEIVALFTPREREVPELFLAEPSEPCIAKRMHIAAQTVRNHMASIETKLGVRSRAELMKVALSAKMREGFLDRLG